MTTIETAQAYFGAMGSKQWGELRKLLKDDFTFRGSMASYDSPDEYIAGVKEMPFEGRPEGSRLIVDGNRVAHAFVWKITAPAQADVSMCEVLEIEGGKVQSSELFYDSRAMPMPN